jgi:hypothetical protein
MNRQMPDMVRSMEAVGTACLMMKNPPRMNTMVQTNGATKLEVLYCVIKLGSRKVDFIYKLGSCHGQL